MAVPWWTLAKAVPWSDVIEHAPTVVNAARKLLKRKPTDGPDSAGTEVAPTAEPAHNLHAEVARLRTQLTDTQQLLQELAEQQARTLAQVEEHRVQLERLRRHLKAVAVVAAIGAVLVVGLLVKVLG
jgi:chromosome segregation ATPase